MSEGTSYRQILQGRLQAQRALISELIHPHAADPTPAYGMGATGDVHHEFPRSVLMRTVIRHPASLAAGLLSLVVFGPRRVLRTAVWALPIIRTQSSLIARISRMAPLAPVAGRMFSSWLGSRRRAPAPHV